MINKDKIFAAVESARNIMFEALDHIWADPETGFKEWNTQKYLAEKYQSLGYKLTFAGNIPGFYTEVDTGLPGPTLMILGEMDSLKCTNHPDCNKQTGAVHACGHCAQSAALLGIATALKQPGVLDGLCGKIRLCAAPAEELIEMEFRENLRKQGILHYYGGKVELMYRGFFDGVDIAFMFHTSVTKNHSFTVSQGANGCIAKTIFYRGKASHAAFPQGGNNALYAAHAGLALTNALRETFPDGDHVRYHPIITYGGTATNAIPDVVTVETYVRAASFEAIKRENEKINRAIAASAAGMGVSVTISDRSGYLPTHHNRELAALSVEVMKGIMPQGSEVLDNTAWELGCTDMGDVASVIPSIHAYISGASGTGHGADYRITDRETALVTSAKGQLVLAARLLENGGEKALAIKANAKTEFSSIQAYFQAVDKLNADRDAVTYNADGTILLNYK